MPLNAKGAARRQQCLHCDHRITRHTLEGERWGEECCYHGFEPEQRLTLSRAFYNESDDDACPDGRWQGLEPVDLEARAEEARLQRAARQVRRLGPVLEVALEDRDEAHKTAVIHQIATAHNLEPEATQTLLRELAPNEPRTS